MVFRTSWLVACKMTLMATVMGVTTTAVAFEADANEAGITSVKDVLSVEQKLLRRAMINTNKRSYTIPEIRPVGTSKLVGTDR
jgi:hypothetical protein